MYIMKEPKRREKLIKFTRGLYPLSRHNITPPLRAQNTHTYTHMFPLAIILFVGMLLGLLMHKTSHDVASITYSRFNLSLVHLVSFLLGRGSKA